MSLEMVTLKFSDLERLRRLLAANAATRPNLETAKQWVFKTPVSKKRFKNRKESK